MEIGKTPNGGKPLRRESFASVEALIDRHGGNGAPLIWAEGTDPDAVQAWRDSGKKSNMKPKGGAFYRRTTTFIDVLGDKSNLIDWKIRKALMGVYMSPGLLDQFGALDDPFNADKQEANSIAKEAANLAGAEDRADAGTAVHSFLEDVDSGDDPGWIPDEYKDDVAAYVEATRDLEVLGIELFCVQDKYNVAGTFDRLVRVHGATAEALGIPDGAVVIADLKTGSSVDYDFGKIAMQLAGYANMQMYNPETFDRSPIHPELNIDHGIVIHLPLGEGHCELYRADLVKGWSGFELCDIVHNWRKFWNAKANKPVAGVSVVTADTAS